MNFIKYCEGRDPVMYSDGGLVPRPPARLHVPEEGRWYVVADLHGYSTMAKATVQVLRPGEDESQEPREEAVLTAGGWPLARRSPDRVAPAASTSAIAR